MKEEKTNVALKLFFSDKYFWYFFHSNKFWSKLKSLISLSRIDFMSDKTSLGAGKKRTINFNTGSSAQETIVAEGMLKSNLIGKYIFLVPNFTNRWRSSKSQLILCISWHLSCLLWGHSITSWIRRGGRWLQIGHFCPHLVHKKCPRR